MNVGITYLPVTEPLNDDELDLLDGVLARVKGGAIPNAEALDGFFTALVICPELVKPSEYMELIRSGASKGGERVFDGMDVVERFHGLLMRHWPPHIRLIACSNSPKWYLPSPWHCANCQAVGKGGRGR